MSINWNRPKNHPLPTYPALFLLDDGTVFMGVLNDQYDRVVGWSNINMPEWLSRRKRSAPGHAKGEDHPKTTLSAEDVELIRELYGDGGTLSYQQLADKFECGKYTIRDIVKYRTRSNG